MPTQPTRSAEVARAVRFRVDEDRVAARLRLVSLHLSQWGLRMADDYRRAFGNDAVRVQIVLAVVAITMGHLMRDADPRELDIRNDLPDSRLARCNIASIAAATGLPRETARRKVGQMIDDGWLRRTVDGGVAFAASAGARPEVVDVMRRQAREVARIATLFAEAGLIEPAS